MSVEEDSGPKSDRIPLSVTLPFVSPNVPLAALSVSIFVYLSPYFTSHLGVSLTVVASAFFIVRMLDLGVDVAFGAVMDRTRTRLGRYRVWMLIAMPILVVSLYQLFMARQGIDKTYLVVWLFIYYVGNSILGLSQNAWAAKLATSYDERSRMFGWLSALGVVGAVLVLLSPIMAKSLGFTSAQGVQGMGWFSILLMPVTVLLAAWRTPEKIVDDVHAQGFVLGEYIELLLKPDLLRMCLAQVCLTLGPGWMSALYLFFFEQSMRFTQEQSSILLLVYILAGIVGAPLTAWLATRFSKHRTLMVTTTSYSLGLCLVMVLPKGNLLAAMPAMFWCGFMASGFGLMISAMLADLGDQVRLEQGKERISLIYAMNGLAAKVAAACSLILTYPLIQRLGFNPKEGAVNTPQAIHSLEMAYIIGPIVFVMLGGACVIGWKLDARRHAEIRRALEDRDAAAVAETSILDSELGQAAPVVTAG